MAGNVHFPLSSVVQDIADDLMPDKEQAQVRGHLSCSLSVVAPLAVYRSLSLSCNDSWTAPFCLQCVWLRTRPSLTPASPSQMSQTTRQPSALSLRTTLTRDGMGHPASLHCSSVTLNHSHLRWSWKRTSQGLLAQHRCRKVCLPPIMHLSQEGKGEGGRRWWSGTPFPKSGSRP